MRYIKKESETYPSKEELDAMYTVSKRGRRRLMRAIKAERYGKPLFVVYLRRVAIILLVTITVAFGALMTNTDVRAAISKAIIKWTEKSISFRFDGDDEPVSDSSDSSHSSEANINSIKINYIPEGMYLKDSFDGDNTRENTYLSFSNEDTYLMINIHHNSNYGISVDNERHNYKEIIINSKKAYSLYDTASNSGTIIINDNDFTVTITGNLKENELMKIAKNIKFSK